MDTPACVRIDEPDAGLKTERIGLLGYVFGHKPPLLIFVYESYLEFRPVRLNFRMSEQASNKPPAKIAPLAGSGVLVRESRAPTGELPSGPPDPLLTLEDDAGIPAPGGSIPSGGSQYGGGKPYAAAPRVAGAPAAGIPDKESPPSPGSPTLNGETVGRSYSG